MASLTGQTISSTYDSLLKVTDNGPITSSLKTVTDGLGNSSSLELSTISARFGGTIVGQSSLDISAEIYHRNNIAVLNKLENSWIHWATRNTAGSDAVINLSNIGTLTLNSTISNGIYTYTLPSATGTLALTSALSSYVPTSRTITINGTTYDLSADRSWTVSGGGGGGTVTSVAALTLGTTGTDLNSSVSNPTTTPVITLNVPTASALNRGVLSSTDWSTFDSKQAALSGTGIVKSTAGVISYLTDPLPIANGGTGSATKNFVDLTTTQTISGVKTFANTIAISGGNALQIESGTTGNYAYIQAPLGLTGGIVLNLPSTGGTLALTSALSSYLPLAGGTLTGDLIISKSATPAFRLTNTTPTTGKDWALQSVSTGELYLGIYGVSNALYFSGNTTNVLGALSGTSASFSGDVTSEGLSENLFIANGNTYSGFQLKRAGTRKWSIFNNNAGTDFFDIYNYGTLSSAFKIDYSTNAVTLVGGLTGTSASFSGNVNADDYSMAAWKVLDFAGSDAKFGGVNASEWTIASFHTSGSEKMRITSGGKVGIGTTSPYDTLEVIGTIGTTDFWAKNGGSFLLGGTGGTGASYAFIGGDGDSSTASYLTLNTGVGEAMRVFHSRNVGIGTTTDAGYKLDVNGTGRFSGAINTATSGSQITNSTAGNNSVWYSQINTGGTFYLGLENSTGSSFGATPFAGLIYHSGAYPIEFFTSGVKRLTIDSTGSATFSNLAGTGTRMVVSDSTGLLSTQAIPGGGGGSVDELQVALLSQVFG